MKAYSYSRDIIIWLWFLLGLSCGFVIHLAVLYVKWITLLECA